MSTSFSLLTRNGAGLLVALLLGAVLVLIGGGNPLDAYGALFAGAFGDAYGLSAVLIKACPILLSGLAVAIPLRLGLFNLGAEGQIYIGALSATLVALYATGLPPVLHVFLCCLAGAAGGAAWASIAAAMNVTRGVNEVITTLLLNYVAAHLVSWVVSGPLMEPDAPFPYSPEIAESLQLPHLLAQFEAHAGVFYAIALALLFQFIYSKGTIGLSSAITAHSRGTALYAGLSPHRLTLVTFAIGGAAAGLAGSFEVLGVKYRLYQGFVGSYGYDGVIAAILAGAQPAMVIVTSVLLAGLKVGANAMQRAVDLPVTLVEALQGLIIICVTASAAWPLIVDRYKARTRTLRKLKEAADHA
jgi:simple sugar transport system permease protein